MEEESKIILYTTPDGKSRVSLMSRDGRVWLNQKQMAELFAVSKMNISLHVSNILKEKELDDSVVKCYFTTAADGKKYKRQAQRIIATLKKKAGLKRCGARKNGQWYFDDPATSASRET